MNPPCDFCGEPYELFVTELYPEQRTFTMGACCEGAYNDASEWLAETDPQWAVPREEFVTWFQREAGIRVRAVWADLNGFHYENGGMTLDWGLEIRPVTQAVAKAFVREHHRHNPPPAGWRWGHGCYNGDELVGVAMVGRPVARALDPDAVVEVNRVCVAAPVAKLTWNACSMLYGAAAKEAKRRGYERIITYTLVTEPGTTLRAAGWEPVAKVRGRSWSCKSRPRTDTSKTQRTDKTRWERVLRRAA